MAKNKQTTRKPRKKYRKEYKIYWKDKNGGHYMEIKATSVAKAKEELRWQLSVKRLPSGVEVEQTDYKTDEGYYTDEREMDERNEYSDWMDKIEGKYGYKVITSEVRDAIYFELQSGGTVGDCKRKAKKMGYTLYGNGK